MNLDHFYHLGQTLGSEGPQSWELFTTGMTGAQREAFRHGYEDAQRDGDSPDE